MGKYIELPAACGNRLPCELLQPFGIDLNDPVFWQGGLNVIEQILNEVEQW
ncbi:MAG: hypothetical protein GQ559_04480 [Desulfobulbaceae bacterium]|nr:hypothetical protein [Desulfobulbaceae bacterium]